MNNGSDRLLKRPGGDDFCDVTNLFVSAAKSIPAERPIFAEGYTLHDAMSALEIGEPRMDSGMVLEHERAESFNPLTPLLSQEVCWILDRSFSCEMDWHAGNTLSQTVYTFLYIHNLVNMNPDFNPPVRSAEDPARPIELVTVVLRAAVFGLLKSCALAWVELAKSRVFDQEDWQSEKSEISLCEGISVATIVARLDEAIVWLANTPKLNDSWREPLLTRLRLRKILLEFMALELPMQRDSLPAMLREARNLIHHIRKTPPYRLPPGSPATLAFDPFITRRLHSFMPLRLLEITPPEQTWKSLEAFISGLSEIYDLSGTAILATWEIVGTLRVWSPNPGERLPYLRSLTQTVFHHGNRVLTGLPPSWIVHRFFMESVGLSYERISNLVRDNWVGQDDPPLLLFETRITKLVKEHVTSSWYNFPRRRRHLMNITTSWHSLYFLFVRLLDMITIPSFGDARVLRFLPHIPLLWRLSAITNITLSGFQLDLYCAHERPFAYWYASQVIETHLGCLDDLLPLLSPQSLPYKELRFRHTFLTALQSMLIGIVLILVRQGKGLKQASDTADPGFFRRYKWAFGVDQDTKAPDILIPNMEDFIEDCHNIKNETTISSLSFWHFAKCLLSNLLDSPNPLGWSDIWTEDRASFLKVLIAICEEYLTLPEDVSLVEIIWKTESYSVFPRVSRPSKIN